AVAIQKEREELEHLFELLSGATLDTRDDVPGLTLHHVSFDTLDAEYRGKLGADRTTAAKTVQRNWLNAALASGVDKVSVPTPEPMKSAGVPSNAQGELIHGEDVLGPVVVSDEGVE